MTRIPVPSEHSSCHHLFRRTSFDMTEITVRVLGPADPTPTPETYTDEPNQPVKTGSAVQTTLLTYGKRGNAEGSRKSKRIRQVREHGKRRKFIITKTMTIKDLKIMASASWTCHLPKSLLTLCTSSMRTSEYQSSLSVSSTAEKRSRTVPPQCSRSASSPTICSI